MWKKNQVIITALAALVAVAGYLNYSGTRLGTEALPAVSEETEVTLTDIDSLDSDITLTDSADGEVYLGEEGLTSDEGTASAETGGSADTASEENGDALNTASAEDGSSADTAGESADTPGEAVLTSTGSAGTFAAQARLSREQVRAKSKETLMEIINNVNVTEEQKQNAIDGMTALAENAEKEAAAELLLETKGFADAVVSITDGTVDVVVGQTELSDAQRAQIEDIVKRKTEISGENIVITTMQETAE